MHAASGEAAVLTPNPRQQHETTADDPMHPPQQKKFAQKQRRRRKRARAVALGPLLAARLRQLAGGTQRALLDAAHTQGPQHHCNTMMDLATMFTMTRARPAPNRERIHFLAPLLWMLQLRAAAAPCVLDKPFPTACPATPLPIIFIACSPLLPRSPADARLRTLLAASEIHRR
jgi:hypothetical protein